MCSDLENFWKTQVRLLLTVGGWDVAASASGLSWFFVAGVYFHICRSCPPSLNCYSGREPGLPRSAICGPHKSDWLRVTEVWTQGLWQRWISQGIAEDLTSPYPFAQAQTPNAVDSVTLLCLALTLKNTARAEAPRVP